MQITLEESLEKMANLQKAFNNSSDNSTMQYACLHAICSEAQSIVDTFKDDLKKYEEICVKHITDNI